VLAGDGGQQKLVPRELVFFPIGLVLRSIVFLRLALFFWRTGFFGIRLVRHFRPRCECELRAEVVFEAGLFVIDEGKPPGLER
jgi:hypothetical protein